VTISNNNSIRRDSSDKRSISYSELLSRLLHVLKAGGTTRLLLWIDVEPDEELKKLLSTLTQSAPPSQPTIVAVCSRLMYMKAIRASLPTDAVIKYAEDYLSADELEEIDRQALDWIRNWHNNLPEEYKPALYYRDIPLGNFMEYELCFIMPQLLKKVKTARTILAREQPDTVLLLTRDNVLKKAVSFVGKALDCPVLAVECGKTNVTQSRSKALQNIARIIGLAFDAIISLWDWITFKIYAKRRGQKLILFEDFERLYPIVDVIKARGKTQAIFFSNEGSTLNRLTALRKKKLYRALLHHLKPAAVNRVRKARNRVKNAWDDLKKNTSFQSYFDYEGLNLWPLVGDVFPFVFKDLFPQAIGIIESAYQGLAFYRPDNIVLNSDILTHGRAICFVARQLGIPTLLIQHGVYEGYRGGLDIISADMVAAWGKSQVNSYIALGNDGSKVEVVGGYLFDKLHYRSQQEGRESESRERICRQLGLDSQKDIFTFTTLDTPPREKFLSAHNTEDVSEEIFRPVVEAIRAFPEKQLVVKLHPSESAEVYHRVLTELSPAEKQVTMVKNIDLYDLIDASEMIISVPSTVALEAIILDKPVIIIRLRKCEHDTVYKRYPAPNVWRKEDIVPTIKSVLEDTELQKRLAEQRARFLSEEGEYLVDGKSTERIINLIYKMSEQVKGAV
jgi:hypothetical protein